MAYRRNAESNRDALFGNAAAAPKVSSLNQKKPAVVKTSTRTSPSTKAVSKSGKNSHHRTLTGQAKIDKMKEAEEYRAKAKKALQRGLFSSPDPIAGGMFYHRAAEAYKLCGENRLERLHRIASADCQQGHGAYATAAQEYVKAAELAQQSEETLDRKRAECTKLYADAAKAWKEENELGRAGECMLLSGFSLLMTEEEMLGGQHLEQMKGDAMTIIEAAVESYVPDPLNRFRSFRQTGLSSFVDQDTVPSDYQGDWEPDEATLNLCKNHMVKSSFAHETLAKAIHKFVEYGEYKSALYAAGAVTAILEADGFSTITLSRAYCAETVLMLAQGDVVAADKQFLEVHLQNNNYLSSRECKLSEDLIRAIKSRDPDELDVARDPNGSNRAALANLDSTLRNLVAFLKISGAAKKKANVTASAPIGGNKPPTLTSPGGDQLQNELDDLMNGMGLGSDEVDDDDDDDDLDLR